MLAPQNTSASPSQIRSLVPVEGNKSLLLICSPAALVGPISRLLSWCPLKPRHCMSYLGLISVSPPREGSMAAGPSPTLDRPLLGSPLPASLACFTLSTLSLSLSLPMSWYIESDLQPAYVRFWVKKYRKIQCVITCGYRGHCSGATLTDNQWFLMLLTIQQIGYCRVIKRWVKTCQNLI